MKRESQFATQVRDTLGPALSRSGFTSVRLKSCIHFEVLYRRGRLWFGATYDVRDQYLELNLGHLYWFRDVMPRVIILGDLSEYSIPCPKNNAGPDQIQSSLRDAAANFDRVLATYDAHYPAILERHLHPPQRKYRKEYLSCLQSEVQDAQLEQYIE